MLESTIITNFTKGELSKVMAARVDVDVYYNGCEVVLNMVALPQGGATKRPGTKYVRQALNQDPTKPVRVQDFIYSTAQAYTLEFGEIPAAAVFTITNVANDGWGGIVVTLAATAAGIFRGSSVTIAGVTGTTEANGTWTVWDGGAGLISYVAGTAIQLRLQGSTFSNAYVSGGTCTVTYSYVRPCMNDAAVTNVIAVAGAANNGSGLVRLQLASVTGLYTGNTMTVSGVTGTTEANGTWAIRVIDSTHVDLVGSAFVHAYVSGGSTSTIVELPLPYAGADLPGLGFVQSTDTLFVCHPSWPPAMIGRTAHAVWTYGQSINFDGPFLPAPTGGTTLTPDGTVGGFRVTLSTITEVNGGQGFLASDLNRLIRIKDSAAWATVQIVKIVSTTVASVITAGAVPDGNQNAVDGAAATANFRMQAWSQTTGWPQIPIFFQQRLFFLGEGGQPNAVRSTTTNGFNGPQGSSSNQAAGRTMYFSPSAADGTVTATHALSWVISDDQVNACRWASPAGSAQSMQLGIGTSGKEQILQPASQSSALSPTNVQVYPETQYGSTFITGTAQGSQALVRPLRIGKAVIFANRSGRRLHEWAFDWKVNGYIGPDLMEFSEHITDPGVVQLAYQQNPFSTIWMALSDGSLQSATYRPDQKVFAPSRHRLGGSYNGGKPFVESICVIPSPDGTYDELWLSVLRTINGATVRTIEVMTRYFRVGKNRLAQEQQFFVDCGLTSPLTYPAFNCTPSGLTDSNASYADRDPALTGVGTFTASGAAFAGTSADVNKVIRINGGKAVITTPVSASVCQASVIVPLTSQAAASTNAWSCTTPATTFGGASHLNGETVSVLGDGAKSAQVAVAAGSIAVSPGATLATAGLPYAPALLTMRYETAGSGPRTAQGRVKRILELYLRLFETGSCKYGPASTAAKLDAVNLRSTDDLMGQAVPLVSDDFRVPMPGGHNKEGQIYVTQDPSDPVALTLLGIVADVDVGQRKGQAA